MTYRFRRWLFRKLMPKNLSVYVCADGETAKGSGMYDPDIPGKPGWGFIRFKLYRLVEEGWTVHDVTEEVKQ